MPFIIAILLVVFGVVFRLVDHPANVAPIAAIGLFSSVYFSGKWRVFIPLAALFISDVFIGFYEWPILFTVYACFSATIGIGSFIKKNKNTGTILAGSLASSVLFFLATNAAVWLAHPETYAPDWSGLMQSYVFAVPFFRNTMLGDLFFTGALFGVYEAVSYGVKQRSRLTAFIKIDG